MEAQPSPGNSGFTNRRQKNLQKYRQHIQRKKTSSDDRSEKETVPEQSGTQTQGATNIAAAVEESIDNDLKNLKVETPPASPLVGRTNKVAPIVDVSPSPVSPSKGTSCRAEGFSPVSGGSPLFKRRPDIMKKLSKKKGNTNVLDSPHAKNVENQDEPSVMADSTNSSQEVALVADATATKKIVSNPDTTKNDTRKVENVENKDVISETRALDVEDNDQNGFNEPPNGFDLRSIHEFPTEPIQKTSDAIECTNDPSWDTAKVFFNEYQRPATSKDDTMNMFDTNDVTSWPEHESYASFPRTFETDVAGFPEADSVSTDEEKKEKDASDVHEPSVAETFPESPDSDVSARRLRSRNEITHPLDNVPINPVFGSGFPDDINTDCADDDSNNEAVEEESTGDDKDLLGAKSNDDLDSWNNETQLSKEERLQQYSTSPKDGDDSSACSSDHNKGDDESSNFSEEGDVQYVSHFEEEKDDEQDKPVAEGRMEEPVNIVEDAPAFMLSVAAAAAAEAPAVSEGSMCGAGSSTGNPFEPNRSGEQFLDVHSSQSSDAATNVDETNTLSISPDATTSEESNGQRTIGKSGSSSSSDTEKKNENFRDIEDSTSLVGVSLVPSFTTNNGPAAGTSKDRNEIPPQGKIQNLGLPPPPPPPLSAKKKKKKKTNGKKSVPLLAPPPEEKLLKWQQNKNRPFEHLASVREDQSMPLSETRSEDNRACGGDSPQLDGGAEQLACADFADAFALDGLNVSLPENCQGSSVQSILSPVDAARSVALGNAMKRANCGLSAPSPPGMSDYAQCGSLGATKTLFEDDIGTSASVESSFSENGPSLSNQFQVSANLEEPPSVSRKSVSSCPTDYLQKLTSPSYSHSPTKTDAIDSERPSMSHSPPATPIIHNQKMAEKVAMASYAAAIKFEEKYSSSHDNDSTSMKSERGGVSEFDASAETKQFTSLFCGNDELQANLEKIANADDATKELPYLFCGPEAQRKFESEFAGIVGSQGSTHDNIGNLKGGAFIPWNNAVYAEKDDDGAQKVPCSTVSSASNRSSPVDIPLKATLPDKGADDHSELLKLHLWLTKEVLGLNRQASLSDLSDDLVRDELAKLLDEDEMLNTLCQFVCERVNERIDLENKDLTERNAQLSPRKKMRPFTLGTLSARKSTPVIAANFVSFLHRVSKASGIPSPFGDDNPYLMDLVSTSIHGTPSPQGNDGKSRMQMMVFDRCSADSIVKFFFRVCGGTEISVAALTEVQHSGVSSFDMIEACRAANPSPTKKCRNNFFAEEATTALLSPDGDKKWVVPDEHPSPFEHAVVTDPTILFSILGCLGDPVAVCRIKMLNRNCNAFVAKNEHVLMRDAVRLGGISMNVRPSFWLWVTLEKFGKSAMPNTGNDTAPKPYQPDRSEESSNGTVLSDKLADLERAGREGKWHHVIQRDVSRAFGNMPPHKTGARLRTDSIVRALVTWGRNRIMKRGVRGDGDPPTSSTQESLGSDSAPTDTVSDWGGVSPVASFTGSNTGTAPDIEEKRSRNDCQVNKSRESCESHDSQSVETDIFVLSGNALTDEMKAALQNKLGFILHALAASHKEVGYCQGMDYVVAHLLRILQDTVRWRAARGTLPSSIHSAPNSVDLQDFDAESLSQNVEEVDSTLVVEETVFRVMDTLFTTYNLQHMYWPELRCLKTCCRVFERLIQIKLPVLADHFEHHELNVGLFALGWFQTLFLYLPSMPSATVCHMWDIWLVERSFKIFFRVATAILFLSQPILLNHELEGMMTYLNTFPDATLLNPDILIACALQIKVTNKMLMEIEAQVTGQA